MFTSLSVPLVRRCAFFKDHRQFHCGSDVVVSDGWRSAFGRGRVLVVLSMVPSPALVQGGGSRVE